MRTLLKLALRERVFVYLLSVVVVVLGVVSYQNLQIEPYPDVSPLMVRVLTQWPGRGAEEVERQITLPIEIAINGTPGMKAQRSISMYGLSVVMAIFSGNVNDFEARHRIYNRTAQANLPAGIVPVLDINTPATGEIYRYTLSGAPLDELKTLDDWVLERRFKEIPGVADESGMGGWIRQYQILVDMSRLRDYNLTLAQVMAAVSAANNNVGAYVLNFGETAQVVRGIGLLRNREDIGKIMVAEVKGTPVLIRDIATVQIGPQPRLGRVGRNLNNDTVEGVVLLLRGANTRHVLERVHKKVEEIRAHDLPKGVKINTFYDRTELMGWTLHTVLENLSLGITLVLLTLYVFLGNLRSALIVAVTIPVALLAAFSLMKLKGISANLLSLGAIDFGILVDASVIVVENIYRHLMERPSGDKTDTRLIVFSAVTEVQGATVFSTMIVFAAYVPLLFMKGVEGKIFTPMAYTMGGGLLAAVILSMTLSPAISSAALSNVSPHEDTFLMRLVKRSYRFLLSWVLANKVVTLTLAGGFLILTSLIILPRLGTEFLPKLEENNLYIRATYPVSVSLPYGAKMTDGIRRMILETPEIKVVTSEEGRPDDAYDVGGFWNAEFAVFFKPEKQWRPGVTKAMIQAEILKKLHGIPGVTFNVSQYIEDNVEEAVSGVKGQNSLKIFGPDPKELERLAQRTVSLLSSVKGMADLGIFRIRGGQELLIRVDPSACARYGVHAQDVENVIQTAVGGVAVTQILKQEERFDVTIRLAAKYRKDIKAIRSILVDTPDGSHIPLSQLSTIEVKNGNSYIFREQNSRYIPVKFSVRHRDIGSAVDEAKSLISKNVPMPAGYRIQWYGEYREMKEAQSRLLILAPIAVGIMFLLLYWSYQSVGYAFVQLLSVPFALTGGVWALYLTGHHLSISAAIGFLSLFGIAIQDGMILINFVTRLRQEGMGMAEAITKGGELRVRPVLMTALLAGLGLLPAALSTGIGNQAQKPLAIVIVGGVVTAILFTLLVLPVVYSLTGKLPQSPKGFAGDEIS
ncbi:MAG: efflux RND transporter permease subunit [Leptospirillum sp.]|jgi:cobalt-zinc-cadmium resistance protein CzcA|nr:CusA/CzcA family heavy metal efflux RND transporter [Nitrospiraceae bacterium]